MKSEQRPDTDLVLLADIGGTNARFALCVNRGAIGPVENITVADFPTPAKAIADYLARHSVTGAVRAGFLGVAGTIKHNRAILTNSGWTIDAGELQKSLGFAAVHLLNDFEALAWALPALDAADLFPLGTQRAEPGAPMLALGPGTGFGAACLLWRDGKPLAVVGEAGHTTLPVTCEREERVIDHLRRRFDHVSVERVLSGPGMKNLYQALAFIEGVEVPDRDAAAITRAALDGSCAISRATLDTFCSLLGTVAGNLALTFCAQGGVYIAGGIVPRFSDYFAKSDFRQRFEAKGRYTPYLRDIPTSIIVRPNASFLGLRAFSDVDAAPKVLPARQ